jgi:dienelactone hydrolase
MPDPLQDFTPTTFSHAGKTRDVYRQGEGPAVIVMAEMPGITPKVAAFARRVAAIGCTVMMPQLFGIPGADPSPATYVRAIVPGCISREFRAFATRARTPVSDWLRALARHAHAECGGPGVGAVGMCFTGGFALGMMAGADVIAPVLSQPSLPIALTRKGRAALGVSDGELEAVKERVAAGTPVLGLRFSCDKLAPRERFETLRRELGDGFVGVEIDSSPGNPWGIPKHAHSVLTEHLVDEPGHPTRDALDRVLELFRRQLLGQG